MLSNTVQFLDGEIFKVVQIPILDDAIVESIESVSLLLTNALGKALLGIDESLLNIVDDDFAPGQFYFESPSFKVRENVGFATITVLRTNGYTGSIVMDFSASDLTAKNGEDYTAITGKLVFGDGEISSGFDIPIINDDIEEGAEALRVRIFDPTGGGAIIPPSFATVIIEDDESGGLVGGIKLDGANGTVYSIALDGSDNVLLGGDFDSVNGQDFTRLARIDPEGRVDMEFDTGLGPNNTVYNVAYARDGGIWVGGLFNQIDGVNSGHLARLSVNGLLDETFDPGTAIEGSVFDILEVGNGLLVGGDFGLVMLNLDGSVNEAFQAPELNGAVYSISSASEGGVLIAGSFTAVNGTKRVRLAKLNRNGLPDPSFDTGDGPDGDVYAVKVLPNGKILVGGLFVTIDGLSARRLALLGLDGSLDRSLDIGSGFNGPVRSIERRVDGLVLVGGAFTKLNHVPQNKVALIGLDGSLVKNNLNELGLNGPVYSVSENPGGLLAVAGSFTEDPSARGHNRFVLVEGFSSVKPARLSVRMVDGSMYMKVNGAPGMVYSVEISESLESWVGFTEVTIPEEGALTLELGQTEGVRYYRAVYQE
jgi:hypothetical protein